MPHCDWPADALRRHVMGALTVSLVSSFNHDEAMCR